MNDFAMSDKPPAGCPIITSADSLGRDDVVLSGAQLSCIGLDYVSTNTRFTAHPLGWHSHRGAELIFMLRGASGYSFAQGPELSLTGGHFLIIPPGMAHRGSKNIREPSTVCAMILDSRDGSPKEGIFTDRETAWLQASLSTDFPRIRPMTPAMRQTAKWLHEGLTRQDRVAGEDPTLFANLRLQVSSLLLHAAQQISQQARLPPPGVVERAKGLMVARLAEPMTIDEVADRLECGRTRLFHAFKRETGMTPVDWLQRQRVATALELLQRTDRTLTDIANAVGLSSSAYLCHIVKRYTGRPPGAHRRMVGGG